VRNYAGRRGDHFLGKRARTAFSAVTVRSVPLGLSRSSMLNPPPV